MVTWNNLDTLDSFDKLSKVERVNLAEVMSGENGANRVKNYSVPMAEGFTYNYAAKAVDDNVLDALVKLAEEAQLAEKFEELYNGAVINTGENRLVLHQLTRGQLGNAVVADGVEEIGLDLEAKGIGLSYFNYATADTMIIADPEQLRRVINNICLLYTSPSPRDGLLSRMPSSA